MPLPGELFASKTSVHKSDSAFGFDRSWREKHDIASSTNTSIFSRAFHGIVLPRKYLKLYRNGRLWVRTRTKKLISKSHKLGNYYYSIGKSVVTTNSVYSNILVRKTCSHSYFSLACFDEEFNSVDRSILRYPVFFPIIIILTLATNFFKHFNFFVMTKDASLYEVWRFWTYSLVCESWTEFYVSTAYQLFVCCPYEIAFGSKSSLITYNLGILLGNVVDKVTFNHSF